MGVAELDMSARLLAIHATLQFYGNAASHQLAWQVSEDVSNHWNEAEGTVWINGHRYGVTFIIQGIFRPGLSELEVISNTDPQINYFRVEEFAAGNISFVDGINSNTGYFKLDNLLNNSTTAAHEFGHTIGLDHPEITDIRGKGIPGIMYPRGTLVDPPFQYDPTARPGEKGGTLNPFFRKVLQKDIDDLHLDKLTFSGTGHAVLGGFSSVWHEADVGRDL